MTAVARNIQHAAPATRPQDANIETRVLVMDKSVGQQSVTFVQLLELAIIMNGQRDTHKLRLSIKSDAYRHQSHARIERWDGTKWQEVAHLSPSLMATCEGLVYGIKGEIPDAWFEQDRNALIDRAVCTLAW